MRTDIDIERDVKAELRMNSDLDPADIAVAARDGVVTVTGHVRTRGQKREAERTAKGVIGVEAVANDIEIGLPVFDPRPDHELARDAVAAVQTALRFSSDQVRVIAGDGWLTLEGEVDWTYARDRAEAAARRVRGVRGVSNVIGIRPRVAPAEVKRTFEQSFRRNAELDANRIPR